MTEFKEYTGKTVEEAIALGLEELGLTQEEAEIRVLEEGKKKLFGYVKARVEIAPKEKEQPTTAKQAAKKLIAEVKAEIEAENKNGLSDGQRAIEFLKGLFELLKLEATAELVKEEEKIEINVTAANSYAVIGKRGAMLDAIQTIAGAVANIGREDYKRVVVDCENYRENREETLKRLAVKLAEKSNRLGKKIKLEAMNPYERRIMHAALSGREDVTTTSEGKEPNRYVVIVPANLEDPEAPAIPAREEHGGYRNGKGGYNKGYNKGGRGYGDRKGGYNKGYNKGGRGYGDRKGGYNKGGYNDKPRSSAPKKPTSVDFFGTFLGNSKDGQE